jgi:hypothetical protein
MSHIDAPRSAASILQGFRSLLRSLAIFDATFRHRLDTPHSSSEVRLGWFLELDVRAVKVLLYFLFSFFLLMTRDGFQGFRGVHTVLYTRVR